MKKIDRYELKEEFGQGSIAQVYLAHDPHFKRLVAIKILSSQFLHDPGFRARFKAEAHLIAGIEHNAIVPVYDFGVSEQLPYLVMQYMPGGSLAKRLQSGPLSLEQANAIIARICAALGKAHAAGIIHRDIKPSNILFDAEDKAYIGDFGIAQLAEETRTITLLGAPNYMAPEQAYGLEADGRTDVYHLGSIYYEMLAGQPPFQASTPADLLYQHIHSPIPSLSETNDDTVALEADHVVQLAMAKKPEDRIQTPADLAAMIGSVAGEGNPLPLVARLRDPAPIIPPDVEEDISAAGSRRLIWSVVGLIILLIITALGVSLARQDVFSPTTSSGLTPNPLPAVAAEEMTSTATPTIKATDTPLPTENAVVPSINTETATVLPSSTSTTTPMPTDTPTITATPAPAIITIDNLTKLEELLFFTIDDGSLDISRLTGAFWSPDGSEFAVLDYYRMRTYSPVDGHQNRVLGLNGRSSEYISWSPDGTKIASPYSWESDPGSGIPDLHGTAILDAQTGQRLLTLNHERQTYISEWSPDGAQLATLGIERVVKIWDVSTAQLVRSLQTTVDSKRAIAWSPDGTKLAAAGRRIEIWAIAEGEMLRILEGHSWPVDSVSWSPDGSKLVSAGEDMIRVWDATNWIPSQSQQLYLISPGARNASWSPDSSLMVVSEVFSDTRYEGEGTIRILETKAGEVIYRIDGLPNPIRSVAWSPDGRYIAAVSEKGDVHLWGIAGQK